MEYPGNAVPDSDFVKIELFSDVAIAEALANQSINWAQQSYLFPKDAHEANLDIRFFERNRDAIDQRRPAADSRGLWRTFGFARLAQAEV
jgi:hypothetical protein